MSHSRSVDNNTFGDNATIHQGDINNVFNYPQERRETPPRPFTLIPFSRDPDFVSRGDIVDQISVRCLEPAGRVALVGLGGVGKSQLAIEFAHRFAEEHSDVWVFWIHAATQERVEEGFRLIADAVKLPERKQPKADIPLLVKHWLSIERNGKWIIILDSADNSEVLYSAEGSDHGRRPFATYIPKSRNGSILLTTRNRSLASKLTGGYKHIINVDTMSETDALTLLERKMGSPLSPLDAGVAEDLVKALDYIPLAISQAAAYIQARKPRCSIEKYLVEFRKSERESLRLLRHEANDIGRDEETSNTVLRTWAISFEHIRSRQRSAADLLSLMSFFDRQGIPEWVLTGSRTLSESQGSESDAENSVEASNNSDSEPEADDDSDGETNGRFEEDILILRNFCLIAVNEDGDEFEMHRLVQLSIKSWLKAFGLQETFMQQYIERMAVSFPRPEYENWAICQVLFAHVQAALDYRPNENTLDGWATLCYRGAKYADKQGKYNIAEQMVSKSKKAYEKKKGKEDPLTLRSVLLLASIISHQGRWDEAEELQVQVMETRKAKFGADYPNTLISMANLASTYGKQGRWDEAEKLQVQIMEADKIKFGTNHQNTLRNMGNLASTYWNQGRWDEAEKLQLQVVEAYKTEFGTGHLDTHLAVAGLALTYWNQGRWDEAEKLQVQELEAHKDIYGTDHPNTLKTMSNLASTYWKQGRWDEAEELQLQVIEAHKDIFGTDHPNTLTGINNLSVMYKKQGRRDSAEKLQLQVVEVSKTKLGADHPHTLIGMNNLARTWKGQGRHEDALALMEDCLQAHQRVFGLKHPNTAAVLETLEKWNQGSD